MGLVKPSTQRALDLSLEGVLKSPEVMLLSGRCKKVRGKRLHGARRREQQCLHKPRSTGGFRIFTRCREEIEPMFGHFCECKREQVIREELGKGKARRVGGGMIPGSAFCILKPLMVRTKKAL